MTNKEFEALKSYFCVLSAKMKERDNDCAEPKTAVDKGYSLAVSQMNMEIDRMLSDLEQEVQTNALMHDKFSWNKFKNNNAIVHLNSPIEANDFCRQAKAHGLSWVTCEPCTDHMDKLYVESTPMGLTYADNMDAFTDIYDRKHINWGHYMQSNNVLNYLLAFNAGQLVIHISNSKEYLEFMRLLGSNGFEIVNPADYGLDEYDYDPSYPYFYIDTICDGMMNANRQYENIKEHYGISEVVEFSKLGENLDFSKEDEQVEYEER